MDKSVAKRVEKLERELQKKSAEVAFLKAVINDIPGSIYWKDSSGLFQGCNNFSIMKLRSQGINLDSIAGKTNYDLFSKEIADQYEKHDLEVLNKGIEICVEETAPDGVGNLLIQLSYKRPVKDLEGNIVGIMGNTVDITHLKKVEEDLRKAKEMAEKANQAKSDFLANMQHDLKTPFSGILGMAECLELMEEDSSKKEQLGYITQSARVFLHHIDQIFDFIHIEQGQVPILEKQFNLRKLIDDVFKMLLPASKNKNLAFTVMIAEDLPTYVIGDQIRLERVLINLLANSVKFTKSGFIKLGAAVIKKQEQAIVIKFSIEDTGIGIPADKLNLLFQPFSRLSPSFASIYPGQGLGLKVVKEFVDEMKGEVHVHSDLGKGTLVKILLPFKSTFLDCSEEEL